MTKKQEKEIIEKVISVLLSIKDDIDMGEVDRGTSNMVTECVEEMEKLQEGRK